MLWVALRMLSGDTVKYLGMIFGVTFCTLLISQQLTIFLNLIERSNTQVQYVQDANVWVMDPRVISTIGAVPMSYNQLYRVRSCKELEWAAPYFRGMASFSDQSGKLQDTVLVGVDDASLVGLPAKILVGRKEDLLLPGAVMMDENGYKIVFDRAPYERGKVFELNDKRAVLVGLVDSGVQWGLPCSVFTRYSTALSFSNGGRNRLSFILGRAAEGISAEEAARAVERQTGLKAWSREECRKASIDFIYKYTGIPVSFGSVVMLGIAVGLVVVALTFTLFIRDNIKQFGTLRAIGVSNRQLMSMVILQGLLVGSVGYGMGLAGAVAFVRIGTATSLAFKGFFVPWEVAVFAACVVAFIIALTSLIAIRTVLKTDPAIVFRE